MKKIPRPDLTGAAVLKPGEMNKIHFGGNRTPLTPEQMRALASEEGTGGGAEASRKAPVAKKP